MEWFKFYGKDFIADPKVRMLSSTHKLMFVFLLCHVSDTEDGSIEYLTEWQLATDCGISDASDLAREVDGFFDALEKLEMIEIKGHKVTVLHYQERQNIQLSDAERSKRYRDKKKTQRVDRHVEAVSVVTPIRERREREKSRTTRGGDKNKKASGEKATVMTKEQTQARAFMAWCNETFKKNYSDFEAIEKNLAYWVSKYSPRDIAQAAVNAKKDTYWKNIMDPYKFLRRKNPRGEAVDRIGEFLNVGPSDEPQAKMVW